MTSDAAVPQLDGVHHLKLPVSDLDRSIAWYERVLGYRRSIDFVEQGRLMGVAMQHPRGGPDLALRLNPDLAKAAAGFDYFSIGVHTRDAMVDLASRLDAHGAAHGGVHPASLGWILPGLHDPDGHEVRFYSAEQHTALPKAGEVMRIDDPRETAERMEAEERARIEAARGSVPAP